MLVSNEEKTTADGRWRLLTRINVAGLGFDVSTVELTKPIVELEGYYRPRYETMIFGDGYSDLFCATYDTREEAQKGHSKILEDIKDGKLVFESNVDEWNSHGYFVYASTDAEDS